MTDLQLNQTGTYVGDLVDVVALGSGRFVAVWTALDADGDGIAVIARLIGADGVPIGGDFVVNQTTAGDQGQPSVAALADGGFAVAWTSGDAGETHTRSFDYRGVARGAEQTIIGTGGGDNDPSATISTVGRASYVVADLTDNGTDSDLSIAFRSSKGARIGAPVEIAQHAGSPEVADLGGGRTVVVWLDTQDGLMKGRLVDGTTPGSTFVVDPSVSFRTPHVSATGDGGFAVSYSNALFVWVKPYDAAGAAVQAAFTTPTSVEDVYNNPLITTLADGRHVVAWGGGQVGQGDYDVFARVYSADWTPLGRDFVVNTDVPGRQQLGGVDVLPDGQVAFTFSDFTQTGHNVALSTIVDLRTAAVDLTGTAQDDILVGTRWNDTVRGSSGADRLIGGEGKDRLLGGSGADTLLGDGGDDVLTGGTGKDLMTGGAGGDQFRFAAGDTGRTNGSADVITDFNGSDLDRIDLSAIDAVAGTAARESFTFIGSKAFSGTAGELRFMTAGGDTFVQGDTDGNSVADLVIRLTGTKALVAGDFILSAQGSAPPELGGGHDSFTPRDLHPFGLVHLA